MLVLVVGPGGKKKKHETARNQVGKVNFYSNFHANIVQR